MIYYICDQLLNFCLSIFAAVFNVKKRKILPDAPLLYGNEVVISNDDSVSLQSRFAASCPVGAELDFLHKTV